MKNKSQLILAIFAAVIVGSLLHGFMKFYVFHDYVISQHVSCSPDEENCFVWECDPEAEVCSEDPEENIYYYKIIKKSAANIPVCSNAEECDEVTCAVGEENCEITLCSSETAETEEVYCSADVESTEEVASEEEPEENTEEDGVEPEEATADSVEAPLE